MTGSPALAGLDLAALDRHLRSIGISRAGELRAELITGGRSNLTFRVSDDVSAWVLRRPPLHGLTPSAHDMGREYRVVAALQGTAVPVAPTVAASDDASILGAPFQMVEFVAGRVVRRRADLDALGGPEVIEACVDGLIRVLVDLHAIEPDAVGLGDFGRPAGYLDRQVRRWGSQWERVRLPDDTRDDDVARLYQALAESIPAQSRATIVHGDYRIDNTILDPDDPTTVLAVLDWELSTLGDPLSDAAMMCVYRDPAMDLINHGDAAWASPNMPSAEALSHSYARHSGSALENWDFYMALAYFKLAVIAAGIDYRNREGGKSDESDHVGQSVAPLIASGLSALS
ncbi:MAG: phosphotransferase family protein [Mycobacterium sp.]